MFVKSGDKNMHLSPLTSTQFDTNNPNFSGAYKIRISKEPFRRLINSRQHAQDTFIRVMSEVFGEKFENNAVVLFDPPGEELMKEALETKPGFSMSWLINHLKLILKPEAPLLKHLDFPEPAASSDKYEFILLTNNEGKAYKRAHTFWGGVDYDVRCRNMLHFSKKQVKSNFTSDDKVLLEKAAYAAAEKEFFNEATGGKIQSVDVLLDDLPDKLLQIKLIDSAQ